MSLIRLLALGQWHIPDRLRKPPVVEPIDPLERGQLGVFSAVTLDPIWDRIRMYPQLVAVYWAAELAETTDVP